jgi:hypothetical protein
MGLMRGRAIAAVLAASVICSSTSYASLADFELGLGFAAAGAIVTAASSVVFTTLNIRYIALHRRKTEGRYLLTAVQGGAISGIALTIGGIAAMVNFVQYDAGRTWVSLGGTAIGLGVASVCLSMVSLFLAPTAKVSVSPSVMVDARGDLVGGLALQGRFL